MVKGFKKNFHNNDDEDLSDLEMDNEEELAVENLINEKDALLNHHARIKQDFAKLMKTKDIPWIETMDLTADQAIDKNLNVDDDIKRELIFYNLTLANTIKGIVKLKENGEKLNRPGDFFAEMVKSDNQMQNIKKQIIQEQQRIKKFEEKKNKIQNIKFAKAMKDSQHKQKADFKKKTREGIESWKQRKFIFYF